MESLDMNDPCNLVPPGSTPLRELAHAIANALTLPADVAERDELSYLRSSRDRARIVLFAMRRIIADHEIENDRGDVMAIAATIRDQTGELASGETTDPVRAFVEAIIATLTISPIQPVSEKAYLQSARQRARRVLLACRRAVQAPYVEDRDLTAAMELLSKTSDSDCQDGDDAEAGQEPAMVP